jgi:hypothetical protein
VLGPRAVDRRPVERRGHDLEIGTDHVAAALADHGGLFALGEAADAIVEPAADAVTHDDVALLLVRVAPPAHT